MRNQSIKIGEKKMKNVTLGSACAAFEERFKTLSKEDKVQVSNNLHKNNLSRYRDEYFGFRK